MARYNGSFKYKALGTASRDSSTGYLTGSSQSFVDGCECQIDKSSVWKRGEDGQMHTYDFDVFISKYFKVELKVGMTIQLTDENEHQEEFIIRGLDNSNRRYIEIWG